MVRYHFGYDRPGAARSRQAAASAAAAARRAGRGRDVPEAALDAAVAIEILHNYSLVHDDIEDGDELRHGRPDALGALRRRARDQRGRRPLRAELSDAAATRAASRATTVAAMMHVLHDANLAMCEGQALDIAFESRDR